MDAGTEVTPVEMGGREWHRGATEVPPALSLGALCVLVDNTSKEQGEQLLLCSGTASRCSPAAQPHPGVAEQAARANMCPKSAAALLPGHPQCPAGTAALL